MKEAYGTKPEDVVVGIGPSICKKCYEIGKDVADIFVEHFSEENKSRRFLFLTKGRVGREILVFLDLDGKD